MLTAFSDEIEKVAWDWSGFRSGVLDEGIPLSGAAIGAGLGGLPGAALGYAAGSGLSVARSYAKGEKPSAARKMLAAGGLGFGLGGLAHYGLKGATAKAVGTGVLSKMRPFFHEAANAPKKVWNKVHAVEEFLPATGATLATGASMATDKKKPTGAPGKNIQKVACEMRRRMKIKRANFAQTAVQAGTQVLGSGRARTLVEGAKKVAPVVKKPAPDAAALMAQINQMKAAQGRMPARP